MTSTSPSSEQASHSDETQFGLHWHQAIELRSQIGWTRGSHSAFKQRVFDFKSLLVLARGAVSVEAQVPSPVGSSSIWELWSSCLLASTISVDITPSLASLWSDLRGRTSSHLNPIVVFLSPTSPPLCAFQPIVGNTWPISPLRWRSPVPSIINLIWSHSWRNHRLLSSPQSSTPDFYFETIGRSTSSFETRSV